MEHTHQLNEMSKKENPIANCTKDQNRQFPEEIRFNKDGKDAPPLYLSGKCIVSPFTVAKNVKVWPYLGENRAESITASWSVNWCNLANADTPTL